MLEVLLPDNVMVLNMVIVCFTYFLLKFYMHEPAKGMEFDKTRVSNLLTICGRHANVCFVTLTMYVLDLRQENATRLTTKAAQE